jgi:hypothetical protein
MAAHLFISATPKCLEKEPILQVCWKPKYQVEVLVFCYLTHGGRATATATFWPRRGYETLVMQAWYMLRIGC